MHFSTIVSFGLLSVAAAQIGPIANGATNISPLTPGVVPTTYELTGTTTAALAAGNVITITSSVPAAGAVPVFAVTAAPGAAVNFFSVSAAGVATAQCAGSLMTAATALVGTVTLGAAPCDIAAGGTWRLVIPSASNLLAANPNVGPPATAADVSLAVTTPGQAAPAANFIYKTGFQIAAFDVTPSSTIAGAALANLAFGITPRAALAPASTVTITTAATTVFVAANPVAVTFSPAIAGCTPTGQTTANNLVVTLAAGCTVPAATKTTMTITTGLGTNPATAGAVSFSATSTTDTIARTAQYTVTSSSVGRHLCSTFGLMAAFLMSLLHTMA